MARMFFLSLRSKNVPFSQNMLSSFLLCVLIYQTRQFFTPLGHAYELELVQGR